MARKIKKVNKEVLESLIKESFLHLGLTVEDNQTNLFLRLFVGAVAEYFFKFPDNQVDIGFVRFKKNPDKRELFAVELIPSEEAGVLNAKTLHDYYTGELGTSQTLKKTMENFVEGLLAYSQIQSNKIATLTSQLKGRRNKNGI